MDILWPQMTTVTSFVLPRYINKSIFECPISCSAWYGQKTKPHVSTWRAPKTLFERKHPPACRRFEPDEYPPWRSSSEQRRSESALFGQHSEGTGDPEPRGRPRRTSLNLRRPHLRRDWFMLSLQRIIVATLYIKARLVVSGPDS